VLGLVFGFDLDLDLRFDKLIHEQTPIFDNMAGEKKGILPSLHNCFSNGFECEIIVGFVGSLLVASNIKHA
jgi:hypothetical protein